MVFLGSSVVLVGYVGRDALHLSCHLIMFGVSVHCIYCLY